ncbi:protein tyrosine kinase, partial [Methylobacterium radiotolerans]
WSRRYDLVLLDTPPTSLLMDAPMLARQVDGVLCCARYGRSQLSDTVETVANLRRAGGHVLGSGAAATTSSSSTRRPRVS